jgi:selenide, water dikinase
MHTTTRKRLTDYSSCGGCAGKMAPMGISRILEHLPRVTDANLLVGTETHDDAGVYRLTDEIALVQTIDFFAPMFNDPFVYGQVAAANALSDVYAMGGVPKTALNLIGYPDDEDPELTWLGDILRGGADRMQKAGCIVLGGHTLRDKEIKFGYAVTGLVSPKRIFTNAAARPGDKLLLTKPLGTGFATSAAKKETCPPELYAAAVRSMIELNDAARDVAIEFGAHSVTDVTGFGLAGHSYEMATGAGVTIVLDMKALPLLPGLEAIVVKPNYTRAVKSNAAYVADGLEITSTADPLRVDVFYDPQTSGGLLIALPADRVDAAAARAKERKLLAAAVVGEVVEKRAKSLILR